MELDEYRAGVINEIRISASQNQTDIIEELLTYYCNILRESEEFDDYYPCNFNIIGHRNKSISLDGYSNTESDGSLILFIVDYSANEELTVFSLTDIKKKMQKLTYYINDVLKGTSCNLPIFTSSTDILNYLKKSRRSIVLYQN